jgi:hypothetical protein
MNTRILMIILELATMVAKLMGPPWNRFPRHFILCYLIILVKTAMVRFLRGATRTVE